MRKLIKTELIKIFSRGRSYIGFAAVVLIVLALELGLYLEGQGLLEFAIQRLKDNFIFEGNLINAYLVTHIILNSLFIHVPFLVALVTGDLLAGEANAGTFRLLLIRPVSRQKLLFAKFMAGLIYTTLLMALMLALSLGIGAILFGTGDLIVLKNTVNIFAADDVIWRFIGAYAYGLLAMITVAALSFMLSAFSDNSIGPIIGTVAIIIGLTIISTVGFSLMKPVNPYLFTYHLPSWQLFFDFEINIPKLINAILVQVVSIFLFLGITFRYFKRKDILS